MSVAEHGCSVKTQTPAACGDCAAFGRCIGRDAPAIARQVVGELQATLRIVRRDDHLYRACDPFASLFVVKAGCVKTYINTEAGDEQVMGFYLPGEIIGFDGLATNEHLANAAAIDVGAVCELPLVRLNRIAAHKPELHAALMHWCGEELTRAQCFAQTISTRSAMERMGTFLLDLSRYHANRGYSPTHFTLPMLRTDIGRHLGLAAETVSRVVNRLRAEQIADIRRNEVVIFDLDVLRALVSRSTGKTADVDTPAQSRGSSASTSPRGYSSAGAPA